MRNKGIFTVRSLIISFVFFMCMLYLINASPFGLAKLVELTGGQSILDMEMMKGYSADRAYEILEALGTEGRAFDLRYIKPLDFLFPLAYGMFYFVMLTILAKNIWRNAKKPWIIGIVGLCAAVFDWLENIMIIMLLKSYPERLDRIAGISGICTQLKSFFTMASMLLIIAGLLAIAVKRLTTKAPYRMDSR